MITLQEIKAAEKRIAPHILKTDLEYAPHLSKLSNASVYLKLENTQRTGSFKIRGAANKLLSLTKKELNKGIVTASSGNHAAALSYMVDQLGIKGTVFLPENVDPGKLEYLQQFNVTLIQVGEDSVIPEREARAFSEKNGITYISPYNDKLVIAGQGIIGLELRHQLNSIESVLVPVGGGGLISGIASALKALISGVEIVGLQPENSAVMFESINAGKVIEMESKPTLSDGTAGGIEMNAITYEICQKLVDHWVLVSENEIMEGIRMILKNHYYLIEGAAGLSVAALLKEKERYRGKNVVLILCGRKISINNLKEVLNH